MRVLVAPQEYKGTLTAVEASDAIGEAIRRAFPYAEIDVVPMADGGPGTAAALLAANGGSMRMTAAHDPLMRPIQAEWALLSDGSAVIECASASGLLRLDPAELDPLRATTFGTGELIAAALDAGCSQVMLALGGSATNDGGAGMAQALGIRLLDGEGRDLPPGGAALGGLARIDPAFARPDIGECRFVAATDVTNPLCGPAGASAVYGPQKGADPEAVERLDAALRRFAEIVRHDLGADLLDLPGGGAAGGLGAGAVAFLGASLRSGAEVVGEAAHLRDRLAAAEYVLTGEGRLDRQTAFGKTPAYVARIAGEVKRPIACIAGSLGEGHEGVDALFDVVEVLAPQGSAPAREEARGLLAQAAVRALGRLTAGR